MSGEMKFPEGLAVQQVYPEEPTFQEWLSDRYGVTPFQLQHLVIITGKKGDYDKMMEWYRRRYRFEMLRNKIYNNNNPFKED